MAAPGLCLIPANADATGVGTRLTVYVLSIFGPLTHPSILPHAEGLANSVSFTLAVQGSALIATAILQSGQEKLTLFHALCVSHLLILLSVGSILLEAPAILRLPRPEDDDGGLVSSSSSSRDQDPAQRKSVFGRCTATWTLRGAFVASFWMQFWLFNAFVWATAPVFPGGEATICNDQTIYVFFGANVLATNNVLRWSMCAFSSLVALIICWLWLGTYVHAISLRRRRRRRQRGNDELHPCPSNATTILPSHISPASTTSSSSTTTTTTPSTPHPARRTSWFWIYNTTRLLSCIYTMIMLELMIRRNNVGPEESRWTFGQVLVSYTMLGPFSEAMLYLSARWDARKERRAANAANAALEHGPVTLVLVDDKKIPAAAASASATATAAVTDKSSTKVQVVVRPISR